MNGDQQKQRFHELLEAGVDWRDAGHQVGLPSDVAKDYADERLDEKENLSKLRLHALADKGIDLAIEELTNLLSDDEVSRMLRLQAAKTLIGFKAKVVLTESKKVRTRTSGKAASTVADPWKLRPRGT